jgi:hypothetical protein
MTGIDEDDMTMAMRLARTVASDEVTAYALVMEAREHVEALAKTETFQREVRTVAEALRAVGELDGPTVMNLIQGDPDGHDN